MGTAAHRTLTHTLARARRFFRSWRFGVFSLTAVLLYHLLLLSVLLVPDTATGALGQFAQDFRRWCLDYDDAQGVNFGFVIPLFTGPVVLGLITWAIYGSQLRRALRRPRALGLCVVAAALLVAAAGAGLFTVGLNPGSAQSVEFPAQRLRTSMAAPEFRLQNQERAAVAPSDYRGRVVVLTGVYARCGATCPLILAQVRRVAGQLSPAEREQLHIMAVTLDPEHDTPDVLAELASQQGVAAPGFHLLSGSSREVGDALKQIGIQRTWNAQRAVIDHNNVFLVLDRQGRLAYRFSIGDLQERWMLEALRLLLAEPEPSP